MGFIKTCEHCSGIHITFDNGYTVSVQWGYGTYSDNHDRYEIFSRRDTNDWGKAGKEGSSQVECAVFKDNGRLLPLLEWGGDTVGGYLSIDELMKLLNKVQKGDVELYEYEKSDDS